VIRVTVSEAKTHLSRLLRQVEEGEEVVITRGGKPVARLVRVEPEGKRQFGQDRGKFVVPEDFNDSLPPEILDSFYS
jgi:prevent-host-death family protein